MAYNDASHLDLNTYFLGAGGLLPRPLPEGLPVVLGQFGLLLLMMFLLSVPLTISHIGLRRVQLWSRRASPFDATQYFDTETKAHGKIQNTPIFQGTRY